MVRQPDMDAISRWERLEWEELPIYVCPDLPDWFVPNEAADRGLRRLRATGKADRELRRLLKRIDAPSEQPYQSRSERLRLDGLKECWMHITNHCNLKCRHCLFSCTTKSTDELSPAACARIIDEAYELGCRLFFLTGGEPLLASAFTPSLRRILNRPDTHVVILTNLSLLSEKEDFLRTLPRDRVHFQVGMDGLEANHEALRGRRAFRQLSGNLDLLGNLGFPATLAMTVTKDNVADMPGLIDYAARMQVANVHYLWLFQKGNADASLFADPDRIFTFLIAAQERAEAAGVKIDNVEILRSQVFSFPGTRYDLSNAGWQSLTVGPDGHVYPTPALVYTDGMRCGPADAGLRRVWEESAVLREVRNTSLHHSAVWRQEPLRYLIGGGDIDHSYVHSGRIAGDDPYTGLYVRIAKWLIVRAARRGGTDGYPAFRLKMGEKLGDCVTSGGDIFFTHSNCVLTLPGRDHHVQVNNFYRAAAEQVQTDILNPLAYEEELVDHIPEEMRYRSYGCGSPVREAGIRPGETVVDLGCGTGIECFIAARLTGERGRIIGIDMGEAMLARAENARLRVAEKLGYDNVVFKKAFLEDLPLGDDSADLVLSNCVLNLSPDKRRGFQEIYRVLKPGGA